MDQPPRKRFDAAALAFHGALIALLLAVGIYLLFKMRSAPPVETPPAKAGDDRRLQHAVSDLRKWIEEQRAPAAAPQPAPGAHLLPREANHVWRYAVSVDPPTWRDIALTYRVPQENGRLMVDTHFRHATGEMRFRLGALEAGDPAHANVRFPGFFLHSAYIPYPLQPGQRVTWSWPWQWKGGVRAGRIKQFEGEVKGTERVSVPAGTFEAVRIDAVIKYIENGSVTATSRETIWLAPKVQGVLKVVREGVAPDEGFRRIVAELAEFR